MTTYNTYQEAKIANPEKEIVRLDKPCSDLHGKFEAQVLDVNERVGVHVMKPDGGWEICNPADYCMTVEKFLADGYKFVDGDLLLSIFGDIIKVGIDYTVRGANTKTSSDDRRYILRSAALEDKQEEKPRTKVEFEKLEFTQAWEAVKESENGVMLFRDCHKNLERDEPRYMQVVFLQDVVVNWKDDNLYRKVERPIAWHEDAIEFAQQCKGVNTAVYIPEYDAINIDGSMTREEACDYARILLEQEGDK